MESIRHLNLSTHEKILAVLSHASIFLGLLIPFGHIIAPLVFYVLINKGHSFAKEHAKNALAFSVTLTVIFIVGVVAMILGALMLNVPYAIFVLVSLIALKIFAVINIIVAVYRAGNDQAYRYPLSFRF